MVEYVFIPKTQVKIKKKHSKFVAFFFHQYLFGQKISFLQPEHRCQEKDGASEEERLSVSARVLALMDQNIHLTGMRTFQNMGEGSQTIFILFFLEHLPIRN